MTVSTPVQQHIGILDAQGLSWRRIAREVGVSRQTVRKYAELEDCSPKPPERTAARSNVCVQLVVAGLVTMIFRV